MENYRYFNHTDYSAIRNCILQKMDMNRIEKISGSDIDAGALDLACRHFRQAGLPDHSITLNQCPLQELVIPEENGVFICNPPYGERLGDEAEMKALYDNYMAKRHETGNDTPMEYDQFLRRMNRNIEKLH